MATISRLVYRFREGNKCIKLLFGSSLIYLLLIFTATAATAAIISKTVP